MIGRVCGTTALMMLAARGAAACPVCFGATDGPLLQGSNVGILALLVVTLAMLAGFGLFALQLARRARLAQHEDAHPPAAPPMQGSVHEGMR